MGAAGGVVAERVGAILRAALRGQPERWWDAEELAAEVDRRAPHLSADPLHHVQEIMRGLRGAEPAVVEWDRQSRPSARARLVGGSKRGPAGYVYRWREGHHA